jgi:23S rRNA (adenine2503-C2)-methyltransferase
MGMGEPAHNLDEVMEAIEFLGTLGNIGHKNLVFSTVGDPRVFERLPQGPVKPALALSLHTTKPHLREQLLPRAPRMSPAELVAAAGRYGVLNMIPFNHVEGLVFRRPAWDKAAALARTLHRRGILTKLRQSAAQDVDGGCGQLRARTRPGVAPVTIHPLP